MSEKPTLPLLLWGPLIAQDILVRQLDAAGVLKSAELLGTLRAAADQVEKLHPELEIVSTYLRGLAEFIELGATGGDEQPVSLETVLRFAQKQ